jgi:DNA-binding NarL/FixJ family response regulator
MGDAKRAQHHFELCLERNRRMGAATWLSHTAYEYGRFLLAQREDDHARELLGEAAALSQRIGMPTLLSRIRALGPAAPENGYPDGLSPREVQILGLVAQGFSNRQLGTALSISEHTAANHVRSILRKTGCANRTEAASYYHRNGLASA